MAVSEIYCRVKYLHCVEMVLYILSEATYIIPFDTLMSLGWSFGTDRGGGGREGGGINTCLLCWQLGR